MCLPCALYSVCRDCARGLVLEFADNALSPGLTSACISTVLDCDLTWPARVSLQSPLEQLWSHGQSTGDHFPLYHCY